MNIFIISKLLVVVVIAVCITVAHTKNVGDIGPHHESKRTYHDISYEAKDSCLNKHNEYRAKHSSPPLKWDAKLAESAQQWADHLVSLPGSFNLKHSNTKYGENLAFSYNAAGDPCMNAVTNWYNEVKNYDFSGGKSYGGTTGHFTQVVWKSTTYVGVGIATKGLHTYVVAQYNPPGNLGGEYLPNVFPSKY